MEQPYKARDMPFEYRRAFHIWLGHWSSLFGLLFLAVSVAMSILNPDWLWGFTVGFYLVFCLLDFVNAKWQARWEYFWANYATERSSDESNLR